MERFLKKKYLKSNSAVKSSGHQQVEHKGLSISAGVCLLPSVWFVPDATDGGDVQLKLILTYGMMG